MFLKPSATLICLTTFIGLTTSSAAGGVLENLAKEKTHRAARISSWDRTGGNNDGEQSNPIRAGETRTIAEIAGAGQIAHVWITTFGPKELDLLRDVILRMYWDGENSPSVEVPLGEFFGLGHGKYYNFDSLPIAIGNSKGLNCYFPMPYRKSAKITVENQGKQNISDFYYYIDYQEFDAPREDLLYFHAQYRQDKPILTPEDYTILEATGRGHYVGCFMFVRSNAPGWWGEGDDKFYIDGAEHPQLHGTGNEDYFCHSWGFDENTFNMRFGAPLSSKQWVEGTEFSVYRFHVEDTIPFTKSIKFTIEHEYASHNDRSDDYSTIAYWYQTEPHAAFPNLPSPDERQSTAERLKLCLDEKRFNDYRKMQAEIQEKGLNTWTKRNAAFLIADSYAVEGQTDKAIEELQKLLEEKPGQGWDERLSARIKELRDKN